MANVELETQPMRNSMLVIEGERLTGGQVEQIRTQIDEALRLDRWPLIVNAKGPVYWLPIEPPAFREFTEWVVSLRENGTWLEETISTIFDRAEEALRKAGEPT